MAWKHGLMAVDMKETTKKVKNMVKVLTTDAMAPNTQEIDLII